MDEALAPDAAFGILQKIGPEGHADRTEAPAD